MSTAVLVIALATVADGASLFFSQFQEASSGNNKYYQIYNPTDAAIDLTGYSLASCSNGCASDGVFENGYNYPTGATIAAGSHRCIGMSAALPMPYMYKNRRTITRPSSILPFRMPPGVKSNVPAAAHVQIMPIISRPMEVDIRIPR